MQCHGGYSGTEKVSVSSSGTSFANLAPRFEILGTPTRPQAVCDEMALTNTNRVKFAGLNS